MAHVEHLRCDTNAWYACFPLPVWLWLSLPFVLFLIFLSFAWPENSSNVHGLPWLLCPLSHLELWQHCVWTVGFLPAKLIWENMLEVGCRRLLRVEEYPKTKAVRQAETWSVRELTYLAVNNFVELTAIEHLAELALSPVVSQGVSQVSLSNTAVALVLCFLGFDCIYAPWHMLMHTRLLYAYVHKHHHRQIAPHGGWYDTASMTPIEHTSTILIFLFVPRLVANVTGLHIIALLPYVFLWYSLEVLNHMPLDVSVRALGYYAAAHQAHHRYLICNYGTLSTLVDRMMGTLRLPAAVAEVQR